MNYELHVNNMKKFYLMLAVAMCSLLSASAQTQQVVWANGRAVMGQAISQVDSIKYGTMEEADRLYLTLPRKVVIHDTIIKTTIVRDTFHIPADAIAGVFSVSADKKVCFAKGNLQYTQSTKTWAFAEHQYDIIGDANMNGSKLEDKIDLFGWSGNTATIQWGIGTSSTLTDYSGEFADWGTNAVGTNVADTWRTLSGDEWTYIFYTRSNAAKLFGHASVNGVNGIIILPDNWAGVPAGLTFAPSTEKGLVDEGLFYRDDSFVSHWTDNIYTLSEWQKMEEAGAVFFPAAGIRNTGNMLTKVQSKGAYWTSTKNGSGYAYQMDVTSFGVSPQTGSSRFNGYSVRLVFELK